MNLGPVVAIFVGFVWGRTYIDGNGGIGRDDPSPGTEDVACCTQRHTDGILVKGGNPPERYPFDDLITPPWGKYEHKGIF